MSRVPLAEFEPQLTKRLDELWGTPRALRELVILRGAQLRRSEYEWAQTLGQVSDEAYARVSRHFDHHDYVELAAVAAFYAMVGRMLDAMAVPLDEGVRNYQPRLK
jgi:alkylhydroperoxidase family enzyme